MSNPVAALLARIVATLPTEAELIEAFEAGMLVHEKMFGENNDDV